MKIHQDQIIQLIEHLRGSCISMDQAVSDIFGEWVDWGYFPEEVLQDIEEKIFLCTQCGWWYDTGDLACDEGDQICSNCFNEEHEEEE